MSEKQTRPLIDCTVTPDLLAGWPVAHRLRASPTACALIEALGPDWRLEGGDLDGAGYMIDAAEDVIVLDTGGLSNAALARSDYMLNALTLHAFASLRAAWQDDRAAAARAAHRPDLWLLIERILAADSAAMTLRMAYEARLEGDEALWRHALGDDCGDMAVSYARRRERHPFVQSDEAAIQAAFIQWFARDERVESADAAALAMLDESLPDLTLEGLGRLSEAAIRCLTLDPCHGAKRSAIGALAAELAGDPAFRAIRNPVGEAHFLQIMDEIGTTRMGAVALRDKKLAARLFPEGLVTV